LLAVALVAAGSLTFGQVTPAAAAELAVQGALRTNGGGPVPDGGYVVVASLYEGKAAAKAIWEELHKSVPVSRGAFALRMGAVKPISDALLESGKGLWVGLAVAGGAELPRVALRPVTSAWHARVAGRALLADKAKHADTAKDAAKADTATKADWAKLADAAKHANTANAADTAKKADAADAAKSAETSKNAELAAVAQTALAAKALQCTGCVGQTQLSPKVTMGRITAVDMGKQPCEAADAGRVGFSAKDSRMWLCTGKAWRKVKLCGDGCSHPAKIACGLPIPDDCGDPGTCPGTGTQCATGTCIGGKCALPGTSKNVAAASCKAILKANPAAKTGVFWVAPGGDKSKALQVRCDMVTDGGGWTLVAYLGKIKTNKQTTAASKAFQPLFDDFGTYDANAPTTGAAFSRLDLFLPLFKDTSSLLARRTSVPNTAMSWPVSSATSWRTKRVLPAIKWLRLMADGKTWVQRTNNLTVFEPKPAPAYTGYNWNTPAGENCDNCGRSFGSALNHRSLLYWEILDDGYTADQWWHANPLSLADSKGADNSVQDVGIWLREQ